MLGVVPWLLERAGLRAPAPPVDLVERGQLALAEALRLFSWDVWDPPRKTPAELAGDARARYEREADRWRDAITEMIAGERGLGWTWEGRYAGDGDFEWCGAFASRCWSIVGLPLETRRRSWASCLRLQRWASCRPGTDGKPNPPPKVGTRLCVALDEHNRALPADVEVHAGDVLIVGAVGSGPGDHITIVESFDGEVFHTVEGNGVGLGPDGKRRQGVVRGRRPLGLRVGQGPQTYHARWLVRPAVGDLT